jgi:hypothetical protein
MSLDNLPRHFEWDAGESQVCPVPRVEWSVCLTLGGLLGRLLEAMESSHGLGMKPENQTESLDRDILS